MQVLCMALIMKILLITPPLLQPNTPYAATPLLTAYLRSAGHDAVQADLSLELLLRIFSREGIETLTSELGLPAEAAAPYLETIGEVVAFLQGRNPAAAERLARRGYLPEGENLARAYDQEEQLGWDFRGLDTHDRARHLASLYLDDVADVAAEVDPNFGFSRYAEKIAASLPDFGELRDEVEYNDSIFVKWLRELTDAAMRRHRPDLVALTVPFPGCLMGALVVAKQARHTCASVRIVLGGGYANTELRELADPAIFDYVDAITLDSGFLPLQRLAEGGAPVRTFVREHGQVRYRTTEVEEVAHDDLPAPDFRGLRLDRYFGVFETLNPVTRLWSDERWNKLVLAHGCCWRRCAFCDTSIDYICRYDPATPQTICDWIEDVAQRTGFGGFHFVDEALPPELLDGLCDEILRRGLEIEWWGNIRFEKRFSAELVAKMAESGCIAVTGGLETCCNRTLALMRKGVTVEHATRVLADLAEAGIMTHAYLMYGFPTQTLDETLQALETVRDLFDADILHSAYWHRFALTAHSDVSVHPESYGIRLLEPAISTFAVNEIPFACDFDHDLERVGQALKAAAYNYMLGVGFDRPASDWLAMAES
ncbi:radical SAM protein [Pontiella sp.]|uniref:B12-binding domain-containing radical SAM protein n=1 Tax=Pontiella sp. TaxID=2837462 RepID=UPI003564A84A